MAKGEGLPVLRSSRPAAGLLPARRLGANLRQYWDLYLIMVPGILYFLIFKYLPMWGVIIAFKDYSVFAGFAASDWVGLDHFRRMLDDPQFYLVFRNTVLISLYKLFWGFPGPIILALLLNEIRSMLYKRTIQTLAYLPHFLSWIIIGGIMVNLLSPATGAVNGMLKWLGFEPVFFLADPGWFRSLLVISDIWKEVGWGAIIYLAALAGVDPQLYEAAVMDGAGKWKQLVHVTLPSILTTIIVLFLLRLGHVLDVGFEQVFVLYNSMVYDVGDVIETYVYRVGIGQSEFSYSTAVGLLKSVISLILVVIVNKAVKRTGQEGIY
ncbi:ABC transporter permease [Paenibacillus mucilaginosus]|uniref:Binding-protein-dependent transport systems inner membrane component n=2 Tax=Paenibacillus mucilaginosus TaxID=61624 RepID=H6NP10_9BACL|nr:ABC transporter permease subunit [Paenibacillus mucilaginosus]AFC31084.1 binding-protein-dependent transport systems inner membrane component [Paenibacillus mucilaginosus 3016]AFH63402.1 protein lplB [Paenibacillus mucilaginosus K02]MCG7212016.1 ABC transporter permease subunit [Paenibacillus mucilaginosus]WDM24997.1 sugar ABC transporter permease [Paenibacillus mucilaginosus]WFA19668.1 sugar ABC transporter permease [Paenibacillus mucilaginosus]